VWIIDVFVFVRRPDKLHNLMWIEIIQVRIKVTMESLPWPNAPVNGTTIIMNKIDLFIAIEFDNYWRSSAIAK